VLERVRDRFRGDEPRAGLDAGGERRPGELKIQLDRDARLVAQRSQCRVETGAQPDRIEALDEAGEPVLDPAEPLAQVGIAGGAERNRSILEQRVHPLAQLRAEAPPLRVADAHQPPRRGGDFVRAFADLRLQFGVGDREADSGGHAVEQDAVRQCDRLVGEHRDQTALVGHRRHRAARDQGRQLDRAPLLVHGITTRAHIGEDERGVADHLGDPLSDQATLGAPAEVDDQPGDRAARPGRGPQVPPHDERADC
jgi:hypothetical protein